MNLVSLVEKAESFFENGHKRYTYAVAGVCFLISFLADFFSPLNLQYITAAIAVICGVAAVPLLFKHKFSSFNIPLFQYLLAGIFVCGGSALITTAYADNGGVLASKFNQVKAYQSMMGVMTSVQEDVAQVRQDTADIKQGLLVLDKETSDNPKKELAKRGMAWHWFNFLGAATSGELEETRLYRQAGMKSIGDCFALRKLFLEYDGAPENRVAIWEEVLAAIGDATLNEECPHELMLDASVNMIFSGMRPETRAFLLETGNYYQGLYGHARMPKVSLLMLAVQVNDLEMVELFLDHGAKPDMGMEVWKPESVGVPVTPLAEAKRKGFKSIVNILEQALSVDPV